MLVTTNLAYIDTRRHIYPHHLEYTDQVLGYAAEQVGRFANTADFHSQDCQKHVLALLLAPIKTYSSLFTALALPHYTPLLQLQPYPTRRAVAGEIARSILRHETPITTPDQLNSVLEILQVLIKEAAPSPAGYQGGPARRAPLETDETIEEQGWLARIVHLLKGSDADTQFKLLQAARDAFAQGNERIKYTTPALLTAALKLVRRYKARQHLQDDWNSRSSSVYKFIHTLISTLYTRVSTPQISDLALRLFLSAGLVSNQTGHEEVSYEFFAQAFTVYEDSISDSRAQFQAVCCIAQALSRTRGFGRENYDTLITKCALHGSKLLKKPDQCRSVYLASHLWWATEQGREAEEEEQGKDGKEVSVLFRSMQ